MQSIIGKLLIIANGLMLTPQIKEFLEALKHLNYPPIELVPTEVLRDSYETIVQLYGGSRTEDVDFEDHTLNLDQLNKPVNIISFKKTIFIYSRVSQF